VFLFWTEFKINRLYKFGKVHALLSNCLTAMLFGYNFIKAFQRPEVTDTAKSQMLLEEHQQLLQTLGFLIYACVAGAMAFSFLNYKVYLNKSFDYCSVLSGIYLMKAAMLVTPNGPLLYSCMLAQWYAFANIVNHRCDSRPGQTFLIHVLFAFMTMVQVFQRGSHRERISSLKFGKVCPGGIFCGMQIQWILIIFEVLSPFIVGLYMLPMIVKARVKDVYALNRKEVFLKETELKEMKKGKYVERDPERFHFYGSMQKGIHHVQLIAAILVAGSSFFVWWSRLEVIFIERSAPKFVFDAAFALVTIPF